jgi:hypothetical protein
VLKFIAQEPMAVFQEPAEFAYMADEPKALLLIPLVVRERALQPTAVVLPSEVPTGQQRA